MQSDRRTSRGLVRAREPDPTGTEGKQGGGYEAHGRPRLRGPMSLPAERRGRTDNRTADRRARVPRTDALLATDAALEGVRAFGRRHVKRVVHQIQEEVRTDRLDPADVEDELGARLGRGLIGVRRVLNGTGVLVHTNLGRSPLSPAAVAAIGAVAGTVDLEVDLRTGRRGRRGESLVAALLAEVEPAAGAHVVNNGAAAIALVVAALAGPGGEVVLSRGELIEIGAGFRIPDLIEATGVRLREVGTTNRTHLRDYQDAIGDSTRLILKIHPSNYRVEGFTAGASVAQLSTLGVPVVSDIGSGLLRPHPLLPDEPDATTHLADGAAVVTASGDKLLGGPQAGLVLTRDEALAQVVKRHPMARAYRIDKLTLAALEATVAGPAPPVLTMLETPADELRARAEQVVGALAGIDASVVGTVSTVGGGGAPGSEFPSWGIALPERFAPALRGCPVPVLARMEAGRCIVDLRAIEPHDLQQLAESVRHAASVGE